MTGKASGFAAVILTAGLALAIAPARAEPTNHEGAVAENMQKVGKPIELSKPLASKTVTKSRARAKLASRTRKPVIVATKSQRRKTIEAKAPVTTDEDAASKTMPATVANARAQLPASTNEAAASLEVATADQMNELDRALKETPARIDNQDIATTTIAPAPSVAPAPAVASVQASSHRPWDESSLVGKIFIAFGGVLTLASAARMLIA